MADKTNKSPGNVSGRFYVDNTCIDCGLCREMAPDIFKLNEDSGMTFCGAAARNSGGNRLGGRGNK